MTLPIQPFNAPAQRPALRQDNQPDKDDDKRIAFAMERWRNQDAALLARDRMVEECLRFLVGHQWSAWSSILQRFVDVSDFLTEEERRWRQRPVFNRLLPWFMLNHSRMTENPPIVTFLPGPDRIDAELADTMDTIFKTLWRETGMQDIVDRVMAWLLVGGSAYVCSRIDPNRGPIKEWTQQVPGPTGEPIDIPLDKDGNPAVQINERGEMEPIEGKVPYSEPEGALVVDVYSPLEVRAEWGPEPFHMKRWHMTRTELSPEVIRDTWGVDVMATGTMQGTSNYVTRVQFGSGWFGSAANQPGSETNSRPNIPTVEVFTLWEAPTQFEGMQATAQSPGGRLLVCTPNEVLFDGPRPLRFKYTSPIKRFDFARVPGRPQGTSPIEIMLQPQRAYNRGWAQILEHRNLVTNPKMVIDSGSGMQHTMITNKPGEKMVANRRANVPPFEWVAPPSLAGDVYQIQGMLLNELVEFGNMRGTEGNAPTEDASGELVKELRFNSDRFLGPTMKRAVEEFARMIEDWMVILPVLWDEGKLIQYAGEDNVARTMTFMPQMFDEGFVNVIPDIESMLPEGRGERQQKVYRLYQDGVFGMPGSPPAVKQLLDVMRFPNLSNASKPGGVHRIMAEHNLGSIMQGVPAKALPWFPWYDPMVHLEVFETFMAGPEYLKLQPEVQESMGERWELIKGLVQQIMMAQQQQEREMMMAQASAKAASKGGGPPDPRGQTSQNPKSVQGPSPTAPHAG